MSNFSEKDYQPVSVELKDLFSFERNGWPKKVCLGPKWFQDFFPYEYCDERGAPTDRWAVWDDSKKERLARWMATVAAHCWKVEALTLIETKEKEEK